MTVQRGGPAEFKRWIHEIEKRDIPKWQTGIHKKIHLQVVNGMIRGTPVGNIDQWQSVKEYRARAKRAEDGRDRPPSLEGYVGGRARGNWQSSAISPKAGEVGGAERRSASETRAAQVGPLANLKAYSRSFITNNVPYINVLNDGLNGRRHSQQAPLHWIEGHLDLVALQFEIGDIK